MAQQTERCAKSHDSDHAEFLAHQKRVEQNSGAGDKPVRVPGSGGTFRRDAGKDGVEADLRELS